MTAPVMLDTNAVAALVKAESAALDAYVRRHLVCVSAITEAEIRFGLARRPVKAALRRMVDGLLGAVDVLPWDSDCAAAYAMLRAQLESQGRPLGPLDLLIAAHAVARGIPLVTADASFALVPRLRVVQWTADEVKVIAAGPSDQVSEPQAPYRVRLRRPVAKRAKRKGQADRTKRASRSKLATQAKRAGLAQRSGEMNRSGGAKRGEPKVRPDDFSRAVERSLIRAGKQARKIARMYGTPVYVMKDGKIVAEKS